MEIAADVGGTVARAEAKDRTGYLSRLGGAGKMCKSWPSTGSSSATVRLRTKVDAGERRLFQVAMTRACDWLSVSCRQRATLPPPPEQTYSLRRHASRASTSPRSSQ